MDETELSTELDSRNVHKHTFWLYSVIIGLSVEEALRHVLPHVGEFSFEMTIGHRLDLALEFLRLALFLCLVVRFYLGSVRYFFQAHVSDDANNAYPNRNYTFDFFFGLVHFSAFLALSLSIDAKPPQWVFMFWLSFIVLYDLLWWAGCRKFDTSRLVRFWAYLNALTFIISIALYLLVQQFVVPYIPEVWSTLVRQGAFMLPVFFFSFLDLREALSSEPVLQNYLLKLIKR